MGPARRFRTGFRVWADADVDLPHPDNGARRWAGRQNDAAPGQADHALGDLGHGRSCRGQGSARMSGLLVTPRRAQGSGRHTVRKADERGDKVSLRFAASLVITSVLVGAIAGLAAS